MVRGKGNNVMNFNKEQLEVIKHKDGTCVVIAGAGSGKSTVSVHRVRELLGEGVEEKDILVSSFSSKSATDLKNKIKKLKVKNIKVGTFHSVCGSILFSEGIDTKNKIKNYEANNSFGEINNKKITTGETQDILSFISYQKNNMITYKDDFIMDKDSKFTESELRNFFKSYETTKSKLKKYDWDDVLLKCYDVLKANPNKYTYKYIIIDESQDNSLIQNELLKLLCPSENIMVVGDYRQAIYKFRGADPSLFMNFKKQYPKAKIVNLKVNYRSTKNIVDKSNSFIEKYYGDYEFYTPSIANNKKDGVITSLTNYSKEDEAIEIADRIESDLKNGVEPNEIGILYRNNKNSFDIERELRSRNIPYFVNSKEGNFFNRKEIMCIMCMLRLIDNPNDNDAYYNVYGTRTYPFTFMTDKLRDDINRMSAKKNMSMFDVSEFIQVDKPSQRKNLNEFRDMITNLIVQNRKGIKLEKLISNIIKLLKLNEFIEDKYDSDTIEEKKESLNSLKLFIKDNTLESFIKFVYGGNKSQKECKKDEVQLMTIHSSKGLEFDNVYLVSVQDEKFPSSKAPLDEEARLFYVAITRAKENLTISQIYEGNRFVEEYFSNNEESNENKTS